MPAYIVGHLEIADPETFVDYQRAAVPTLREWGGRILAGGPVTETLEGAPAPNHNVLIEFESEDQALGWYRSEGYQQAVPLRQPASVCHMLAVLPGLSRPPKDQG